MNRELGIFLGFATLVMLAMLIAGALVTAPPPSTPPPADIVVHILHCDSPKCEMLV